MLSVEVQLASAPRAFICQMTSLFHDVISSFRYCRYCGYRWGTVNSNTANSKFDLIRSFFEIFARFLSFHV